MFIPLKDTNPLEFIRHAYVNWTLIAINILIFAILQGGLVNISSVAVGGYGITPATLFGTVKLDMAVVAIPSEFTLLTYMFLHGSWMHLITNMLFLWVFGDNIEDAIGHFGYLVFYLACGVLAGLTHAVAVSTSDASLVGASGAVAGVMGAYFMLHPKVRVWVLLFWRLPLPLPAFIAIGLWIGLQILSAFMAQQDNIAWWAHIGGFVSGVILIIFARRKSLKLLDMS